MLSSFVVLVVMYTGVMLIGNIHMNRDDVRASEAYFRTLICAMQVFIVTNVLAVYLMFKFFIRVVKTDRVTFVMVTSRHPAGESDYDLGTLEKRTHDAHDGPAHDAAAHDAAAHDSPDEQRAPAQKTPPDIPRSAFAEPDTHSEDISVHSNAVPSQIVFERRHNLDLYILYVNFVGIMLWCTFTSFNYAMQDLSYMLTSGMVSGWILNRLAKECHFFDSHARGEHGQKVQFLVYTVMFVLIMCLGFVNWEPAEEFSWLECLEIYLPVFSCGVFWTTVGSEVAFTGVENLSNGIYYDTRRSLPTFMLYVFVGVLCSAPETRSSVSSYVAGLSRTAAVHLLLVEPMLVFLSIYIMLIALEKNRSTDLTVSIVLVQGIYLAYRRDTHDAIVITSITSTVLLCVLHITHLCRRHNRSDIVL